MFDAVKNYLALANGVTEVTRQRALAAARALVSSGEATAEQVTSLADDLLTTSRNNRDTVLALMRYEIDRALVRLGLATSEEITALAERVSVLESTVRTAQQSVSTDAPAGAPTRPTKRATKTARKAPAKRSPAKRSPAKRVAGTPPAGGPSAASPRAGEPGSSSGPATAAGSATAQKRPAKKATKRAGQVRPDSGPAVGPGAGAAADQS